jgi:hypothetical protein
MAKLLKVESKGNFNLKNAHILVLSIQARYIRIQLRKNHLESLKDALNVKDSDHFTELGDAVQHLDYHTTAVIIWIAKSYLY